MASTIKQRLRRFNGTDYDTVHLETDGSVVSVTIENTFINPLDTSDLTLGQHDVYFKAYPDIKWCVDHLDGDYVYLGLYNVSEKLAFGSDVTYKGSALAAKCETFLNTVIPNVADYLESVTVNSNNSDYAVTAKVFVPSGKMLTGSNSSSSVDSTDVVFSYPSASASNRVSMVSATTAGSNWTNLGGYIWSSSPNSGIYVKALNYDGSFSGYHLPSYEYGFRPEVKVRYKQSSSGGTITTDLNTALNNIPGPLTFDTTPTEGSTNPVTSGGIYEALQSSGGGSTVYSQTFTASNWSSGTMTIAAATHGITGDSVVYQFYHLVDGSYVPGTWACIESYADINSSTHVITLHGPTAGYAGKVVLVG